MKSISELTATALAHSSAPPAAVETVDLEAWSKFFAFDLSGHDKAQLEHMVTQCALFCKRMKAGGRPYWLSLLGTSGAGKTYLARRIFRWHSRCGLFHARIDSDPAKPEVIYPQEWVNWPELAAELKGNSGYEQLRELESADFAVFDEIGANRDPSGHVTDCLANALCRRVGRWTIITSNKSLGEIQRELDTRVSSRMIRDGSVVVDVDLPDFCLRKASA